MSEFNNERMGILLDMLGKEQATVRNKCGTVFGISKRWNNVVIKQLLTYNTCFCLLHFVHTCRLGMEALPATKSSFNPNECVGFYTLQTKLP